MEYDGPQKWNCCIKRGAGNSKGCLDRWECSKRMQNDLFSSKDSRIAATHCLGQSAIRSLKTPQYFINQSVNYVLPKRFKREKLLKLLNFCQQIPKDLKILRIDSRSSLDWLTLASGLVWLHSSVDVTLILYVLVLAGYWACMVSFCQPPGIWAIKHNPTHGDNHKMGFPFAFSLETLATVWASFSWFRFVTFPFFIVVWFQHKGRIWQQTLCICLGSVTGLEFLFLFGWVLVGFGLCRRNRDWCCSVCFLGYSRGVYRPRLDLHVEVRKKPLFSPFNECQITHTQCGLPLYYIVLCLFGQIMQIAWQQWGRNVQVAKSILVRMSYSTREAPTEKKLRKKENDFVNFLWLFH